LTDTIRGITWGCEVRSFEAATSTSEMLYEYGNDTCYVAEIDRKDEVVMESFGATIKAGRSVIGSENKQ
jgi:hypothetical protein